MQNRRKQLNDELLVIRCQQGDSEAFGQLVGLWQEHLWRYAFKVTGSRTTAWDIVQETWCSVIKGLGRLKDVSVFPSWLFRIANNKCADWARRQQRQSRLHSRLEDNRKPQASEKVNQKADALHTAMAKLEPERRALIVLRYSEGFNVRQIAEILNIPQGTVKSRLHRTVTELRQSVERDSNE